MQEKRYGIGGNSELRHSEIPADTRPPCRKTTAENRAKDTLHAISQIS